MIIDLEQLKPNAIYHVLTQSVIPRPIAWVLSLNELGENYNLAPFSYFNVMCSEPALLAFSVGLKEASSKTLKDTVNNILREKEFVVHIPSIKQQSSVVKSAEPLNYGESELNLIDESLVDFYDTKRLLGCPIAMQCELFDYQSIGSKKQQSIIWGEIKQLYVDDNIVSIKDDRVTIDAEQLNPLARLGSGYFGSIKPVP